ncbi:MAG: 50S ribosomal protein L13 [Pseudomonadota bacterium]
MKTYFAKNGEVEKKWYVIDASGAILGRLATEVANIVRGKYKPEYTPHADVGDFVVITNASKIKVTGNKLANKMYYRHTGYIGGIKETSLGEMLSKHPDRVIKLAVKNMLQKNIMGRKQLTKVKVYANENHPHEAQKPAVYKLK